MGKPKNHPSEEPKPEDVKQNKSIMQLDNENKTLMEQVDYLETAVAQIYDWLDTKQNELGTYKQMVKNTMNQIPGKGLQVKQLLQQNKEKAKVQQPK